jgi:transposase-like protein
MNNKKQEAQRLYFSGSHTYRQVAGAVGVSERTIYNWIKQHSWDTLRTAALQAPALIAENLASQIVELQNAIAAREPGQRFPTPQEAEVTRKLIGCYEKMKHYPSLSQSSQVLQSFRNFVKDRATDDAVKTSVANWSAIFLQANAKNGYSPYQLEYGADRIPPCCPTDEFCQEDPVQDEDALQIPEEKLHASQTSGQPEATDRQIQLQRPAASQKLEVNLQKPEIPLKVKEAEPLLRSAPPKAEMTWRTQSSDLQKAETGRQSRVADTPPGLVAQHAENDRTNPGIDKQKPGAGIQRQAPGLQLPAELQATRLHTRREQMKQITEDLMARYGLPGKKAV